MIRWRRWLARSWLLSVCHYRLRGMPIAGRPSDEVWYFAYGANMNDEVFGVRRAMTPLEWRVGRAPGWRLRFNLDGRPIGKAAPANLCADAAGEAWGVLYRITRAALLHLDSTEGVPGRRYRHLWLDVEDEAGTALRAVTYIADGNELDGHPSQRYITLIRDGARAHGLPEPYLSFLGEIKHAQADSDSTR